MLMFGSRENLRGFHREEIFPYRRGAGQLICELQSWGFGHYYSAKFKNEKSIVVKIVKRHLDATEAKGIIS